MSHIFGLLFSAKRYKSYKPYVSWQYHSKYKGLQIERAYTVDNNGLRHDKALYRAGVGVPTIARILGHESTEVTLKYIGVDLDDMRAAMNAPIYC